jgi:hypothetical protein
MMGDHLADPAHVATLQEALEENEVGLLLFDLLDLALLAGQGSEGLNASNL